MLSAQLLDSSGCRPGNHICSLFLAMHHRHASVRLARRIVLLQGQLSLRIAAYACFILQMTCIMCRLQWHVWASSYRAGNLPSHMMDMSRAVQAGRGGGCQVRLSPSHPGGCNCPGAWRSGPGLSAGRCPRTGRAPIPSPMPTSPCTTDQLRRRRTEQKYQASSNRAQGSSRSAMLRSSGSLEMYDALSVKRCMIMTDQRISFGHRAILELELGETDAECQVTGVE